MLHLQNNFRHAFRGIRYAVGEPVFKTHCVVGFVSLVCAFLLPLALWERFVIIILIGWILSLEMLNTIVEHIIDLLKPEFHEHAKVLKDLSSGAVLVSSIAALIVGLTIFVPKFTAVFMDLAERLSS